MDSDWAVSFGGRRSVCLPCAQIPPGLIGAFPRGLERWFEHFRKFCLRPISFRLMFNRMVEYRSSLLDRTFGALADPTRRRILAQLAKGQECVTDLARPHAMSLAAVSKHLIVLEKAGLVRRRRNGRVHSLALEAKPMREAQAWIDRYRKFWEGNLDQFEKYLDRLQTKETKQDNHE